MATMVTMVTMGGDLKWLLYPGMTFRNVLLVLEPLNQCKQAGGFCPDPFKVATIGFDEVYEVYELYWIYGLIYFRLDH